MKNKLLFLAILLASLPTWAGAAAQLDTLKWMSGAWQSNSAEGIFEINFTEPTGGLVLGVSKLTDSKTNQVSFYEFIQIKDSEKGLTLTPMPFGQPGVSFTGTEVTKTRVVFENPTHDFPRKITYEIQGAQQIALTAEGTQKGQAVKFQSLLHKK